jgi:serine/threonine protein kinase
VLKTKDPLLVDLVHNIMQYSPKRRFSAEDALKHKYFDDLRSEDSYKELYSKVKVIPELFDFLPEELSMIKNPELLIPKWV